MRPALLVVALLAGCQFDGGLGAGLLCPTGECPAGQRCVDGTCTVGAADPDAAPDRDGPPADGAPRADAGPEENLVDNPGMEDGTPPWTPFNARVDDTGAPRTGERSLVVCAETPAEFTVYQDVLKAPNEAIPAGQAYVASAWVRAVAGGPAPGGMMLTLRESGGASTRIDHDGAATTDVGDAWVLLEARGTVQEADRENFILIVWGLDAGEGACFAVDDAAMRPD